MEYALEALKESLLKRLCMVRSFANAKRPLTVGLSGLALGRKRGSLDGLVRRTKTLTSSPQFHVA